MSKNKQDQFNVSLPPELIRKFDEFYFKSRREHFQSRKEAAAFVIETGLEICKKKLKEQEKTK